MVVVLTRGDGQPWPPASGCRAHPFHVGAYAPRCPSARYNCGGESRSSSVPGSIPFGCPGLKGSACSDSLSCVEWAVTSATPSSSCSTSGPVPSPPAAVVSSSASPLGPGPRRRPPRRRRRLLPRDLRSCPAARQPSVLASATQRVLTSFTLRPAASVTAVQLPIDHTRARAPERFTRLTLSDSGPVTDRKAHAVNRREPANRSRRPRRTLRSHQIGRIRRACTFVVIAVCTYVLMVFAARAWFSRRPQRGPGRRVIRPALRSRRRPPRGRW